MRRALWVKKIAKLQADSNQPRRADQIMLARSSRRFRFLLRMLRAADPLTQIARMTPIESPGDRLCKRRLLCVRYEHRRPRD
jgi:hypothetical protein